jgi:hypothetical protein
MMEVMVKTRLKQAEMKINGLSCLRTVSGVCEISDFIAIVVAFDHLAELGSA